MGKREELGLNMKVRDLVGRDAMAATKCINTTLFAA